MSPSNQFSDQHFLPVVDALEARVLLTTVEVGVPFFYHNSLGSVIRVDLLGNNGDRAELLSMYDDGTFSEDNENLHLVDVVGAKLVEDEDTHVLSFQYINWFDNANVVDPATGNWLDPSAQADVAITVAETIQGVLNTTPEVQTLTPSGNASTGTFIISYMGAETAPLPFNATAADVLAALAGLPGLATVQVTGGGFDTGKAFTITFPVELGNAEALVVTPTDMKTAFQRGGWTEIYAIYFPTASSRTQLIMTPMSGAAAKLDLKTYNDVAPWGGTVPIVLHPVQDPDDSPENNAPAGSGAVLVGALHLPQRPEPGQPTTPQMVAHYVGTDVPTAVFENADALGVFPGGTIAPGITVADGDMGKMLISGTVAGQISIPGSLGNVDMGFLWGDFTVDGNVDNIILMKGGGEVDTFKPVSSDIRIGGVINMIDTRGNMFSSSVVVTQDPTVDTPTNIVKELEPTIDEDVQINPWLRGTLVGYDNDSTSHAQFLGHLSGDVILQGQGAGDDYYAIPLMAGHTVTINGTVGMVDSIFPYDTGFMGSDVSAFLYASDGTMVDSLGFAISRDSDGYDVFAQKPIVFTAPEAGIYYLKVVVVPPPEGSPDRYTVFIENGSTTALAGVNVVGGQGAASITVTNGGDLGAVRVTGSSIGSSIKVLGGGDLVAFEAGTVGAVDDKVTILSESNIGRVASTTGDFAGRVTAGSFEFNRNAYIQNLYSAGDWLYGSNVKTTGSIGVMEVTGTVWKCNIFANSDNLGAGGHVDLIQVGGDWGKSDPMLGGAPVLRHGLGGNFGYIRVEGQIYNNVADGTYQLTPPTSFNDGRTVRLNDDGGGHLTITPVGTTVKDEDGLITTTFPTVSYAYVNVDDGVGGVIAKLTIDGEAGLSVDGVVHLSQLDLTGASDISFSVGGTGEADIYYLEAGSLISFTNATKGSVISGSLSSIESFSMKGSLGAMGGTTGAWIFGFETAPTPEDLTSEPQFGWFRHRINGLNISGDVGTISVGGAIGDIRVGGEIGTITANSDKVTRPGKWDGIEGLIWSGTSIGTINVGDGLADTGAAEIARAAILSTGTIGNVFVHGPRFTMNGRVFHELDGVIFALNEGGNSEDPAIGNVVGTGGATLTADVLTTELNMFSYFVDRSDAHLHGGIHNISFSGEGSRIYSSIIHAQWIDNISASIDSDGITDVDIYASGLDLRSQPSIGKVAAGGPGMYDVDIDTAQGRIGSILGLGPRADIISCTITTVDGINSISFRDFISVGVTSPGTIKSLTVTRDMAFNSFANVGGMDTVKVGRDFSNNTLAVAGRINSFTIGGDFDTSSLLMQGPETAWLKFLSIGGDVTSTSTISSAGKVGTIVVEGTVEGEIKTTSTGAAGTIDKLIVRQYLGELTVGGSLNSFVTETSLGIEPTAPVKSTYNVWGDLGKLQVISVDGGEANLNANLNVGGNIGTIQVDGDLLSAVQTNGSVGSMIFKGSLGAMVDTDEDPQTPAVELGKIKILGTLGNLQFNGTRDLVADLEVGGSIKGISMKGGSVLGDIISQNGSIGCVTTTTGNIQGQLIARSIGKIAVGTGNITGDINVTDGNLTSLAIKSGDLDADVTVSHGDIGSILISNGNARAGNTISASGDVGSVKISNGDLDADLLAGGKIGCITIKGGNIGGLVSAEEGIGTVKVDGRIVSTTIRSGGSIGSVSAGGLNHATISSGLNIGAVSVGVDSTDSYVLAGFDVGPDGVINTADDNVRNGGIVHWGNLGSFTVKGAMIDTVACAGVAPDAAGNYLPTANDTVASGNSSVLKIGAGSYSGNNIVLADTSIDAKFLQAVQGNAAVTTWAVAAPSALVGTQFGQSIGNDTLIIGGATLTLTGPGSAYFDQATGNLILYHTTSASKLTISGSFALPINITGTDDSALGSLTTAGSVDLDNVTIDGLVGKMSVAGIADGATFAFPGGVKTGLVNVGGLRLDFAGGNIGTFTVTGDFADGSFQSDLLNSLTVQGDMGASMTTSFGGASKVVIEGSVTGDVVFNGDVKSITTTGGIFGDLTLNLGDLTTLSTGGSILGAVNVVHGIAKSVKINSGNFGRQTDGWDEDDNPIVIVEGSFRAERGIGSFAVSSGNFLGIMGTRGSIGSITVGGIMGGRVGANGNIATVTVGEMSSGLIAAGHDLTTVTIAGDMWDSWLMSGYYLGDAGFAANGDTEEGNIDLDIYSPLPIAAENEDLAGNGSIGTVKIGGDMMASSISAACDPGDDGYLGTYDDFALGVGTIGKVTVTRGIYGSGDGSETFGIEAASNYPTVTSWGQPYVSQDNVVVQWLQGMAGNLIITGVDLRSNAITISFNHPVNLSTVMNNLQLFASTDEEYADPLQTTDLLTVVTVAFSYDPADRSVTIVLDESWTSLKAAYGEHFRIVLNGDAISDNRANLLDGEYTNRFPTGDGAEGGVFSYDFQYGKVVLDVPAYIWWFGCSPTSAGMLVGYYDGMAAYEDLIEGDATTQTAAVNNTIASSGDGIYECDASGYIGTIVAATPGTGNIGDYAIYGDVDDYSFEYPYDDMSSLNPGGAHADDSLADFLGTGRSALGLTMGGSWESSIDDGIESFFDYKGYSASSQQYTWGSFDWSSFVSEINSGRPMILGVDSDADGQGDHSVVAIGYNVVTQEIAIHDTWTTEDRWIEFTGVREDHEMGIYGFTTVEVA